MIRLVYTATAFRPFLIAETDNVPVTSIKHGSIIHIAKYYLHLHLHVMHT